MTINTSPTERLKRVADVAFSSVDKKSVEGDIPVKLCNYRDVYYNDEISSNLTFMDATATLDQIRFFGLRAGDILITKDSETAEDIGVPAFVPKTLDGVVCGYHLAVLRPRRSQVDPKFLFWVLASQYAREQMEVVASGVTRYGLRVGDVGNLRLYRPSFTEQRRIAEFLDRETARIDQLIYRKRQLAELLRQRIATVSGDVVARLERADDLVDSGIPYVGKVPAHWHLCRNKNILSEVQEVSESGEEELLTVSHLTGVTPRSEKDVYMFMAESLVGYKIVRPGELVINTMWAWMGALGVSRWSGAVSPGYGVYRFDRRRALPSFYDLFYRTPAYVTLITRYSKGVWTSRLRLYPEVFLGLRTVVPPLNEQKAIVEGIRQRTRKSSGLIQSLEESVTLLLRRREALVTAAVTGQIDVASEVA